MPGNRGWTDDLCVISNFMANMDQNQFQTQKIHDVANETVAEQVDAEDIASQLHDNNVHIMNKEEWTNKEKLKIVQINIEERQKSKNFIKKILLNFRERKERRRT